MKVLKPFTKNKVYPKPQEKGRDWHWGAVGVLCWAGGALLAREMQNELKEGLTEMRTA